MCERSLANTQTFLHAFTGFIIFKTGLLSQMKKWLNMHV